MAPKGIPTRFRILARSTISANLRDRIKTHASSKGVLHCDIWSGRQKFEEFLRRGGGPSRS